MLNQEKEKKSNKTPTVIREGKENNPFYVNPNQVRINDLSNNRKEK